MHYLTLKQYKTENSLQTLKCLKIRRSHTVSTCSRNVQNTFIKVYFLWNVIFMGSDDKKGIKDVQND